MSENTAPTQEQQPSTPPATTPAQSTTTEAPPAPAGLSLKFPEGYDGKAFTERFTPLATELKLEGANAQKVVDFYLGAERSLAERTTKLLDEQREQWASASKSDKEFGGDAYEGNRKVADSALVKFASPEFVEFLKQTGLANHPEMVRFAYRVGKASAEDSLAGTAAPSNAPDNSAAAFHRQLYPNSPDLFRKDKE